MDKMHESEILIVIRAGAMETSRDLEDGDVIETLCEALSHFCEAARVSPKVMMTYFDSKNTDN